MSGTPYPHPMDDIEPPAQPVGETAKAQAMEIFNTLVQRCLPPRGYGGMRRWEAGWRRMVVFTFEHSPEFFNGMDKRELAAALGLTYRALMLEFDHVRSMLGTTRPVGSNGPRRGAGTIVKNANFLRQKLPGPPPGSPSDEVPRDPEPSHDAGSGKIGSQ